LLLARSGMVLETDGCSFDGGAGFLRSTVTLVSWALALILHTYVVGGGPGGTSFRTARIPTAYQKPLAILCISSSVSLPAVHRRAVTFKTQNMDLLVAGLRGIEPYGLYQIV
jgi:hypothetical protein